MRMRRKLRLLISLEQILAGEVIPIKSIYFSATLTFSRMQLPQTYDHVSTAAYLCSPASSLFP